jgi:hypothetical protein
MKRQTLPADGAAAQSAANPISPVGISDVGREFAMVNMGFAAYLLIKAIPIIRK